MARRTTKRKMTVELVERGELLNLRLIGETMARSMRQQYKKGDNNEIQIDN